MTIPVILYLGIHVKKIKDQEGDSCASVITSMIYSCNMQEQPNNSS